MKLSDEEKLTLVLRQKCISEFYFYVRYMFFEYHGYKFITAPHHKLLCDTLQKIHEGKLEHLIANMPRRYSKTEIVVLYFISWSFGLNPQCNFIHASYLTPFAEENSWKIREIIKLPGYQRIFPHVQIRKDAKAKRAWYTTAGGALWALGLNGSPLGRGAGILGADSFSGALVLDDPHKNMKELRSTAVRDSAWKTLQESFIDSTNNSNVPLILTMQRLGRKDISGRLLDEKNLNIHHICIKALDENNRSTWEKRRTTEWLLERKKFNPIIFSTQFQQETLIDEGNRFKEEYFEYYDDLPLMKGIIVVADTALKDGQDNDYTVIQVWGWTGNGYGRKPYLIDQRRGKFQVPELESLFLTFYNQQIERFGGLIQGLYIEDKASGIGLNQSLRRKNINVVPLPATTGKEERVNSILGFVAGNKICLPRSAPWLQEYKNEHLEFPNGLNDDQVDTTTHAQHVIYGKISIYETKGWI